MIHMMLPSITFENFFVILKYLETETIYCIPSSKYSYPALFILRWMSRVPSRQFGRFGLTTSLFRKTIQAVMMFSILSTFRIDYVRGFAIAKGSICHKRRMCSFAINTIMTNGNIEKQLSFRSSSSSSSSSFRNIPLSTIYSSSSLSSLRSSSSSTSTSVETNSDGNLYSISLSIPTMEIMEEVGALIAILSQPTDVLFLDGDLGAGKTTFSRGFIKCKLGIKDEYNDDDHVDEDKYDGVGSPRIQQHALRITSPTYLLSNTYVYKEDDNGDSDDDSDDNKHKVSGDDGPNRQITREIHHMDLYRLSGKSPLDFEPLGLERVFSDCISLIEWPSRLKSFPDLLPEEEQLLQIDLRIPDPISNERVMSLVSSPESSWTKRLQYLVDEGMVDDLLLNYEDDDDDDDEEGDDDETLNENLNQR